MLQRNFYFVFAWPEIYKALMHIDHIFAYNSKVDSTKVVPFKNNFNIYIEVLY